MRVLPVAAVSILLVLAGCFGPGEDEDGISADVETEGWNIIIQKLDGSTETRRVTSDPGLFDTDGDGLSDYQEWLAKTDPRDPDTDGDGLLDGHDQVIPASSAKAQDWAARDIVFADLGGGSIRFKGEWGVEEVPRHGDAVKADTDGDGLSDGQEVGGVEVDVCGEMRRVETLVHAEDTDGDSLFDGEEIGFGTDASKRDTDGDGVHDQGDLDPCRDVHIRFIVQNLTITDDPENAQTRTLSFHLNVPGDTYVSDEGDARQGEATDGTVWSLTQMDVMDSGGDLRAGEHNMSFTVTALSQSSSGAPLLVDLFSDQTGSGSLIGHLDARSGALRFDAPGGKAAWPGDATFTGNHGTLTFQVQPER